MRLLDRSKWGAVLGMGVTLSLLTGCIETEGPETYLEVEDPNNPEEIMPFTLDVRTPPEGTETLPSGGYPGLVLIHGGGWAKGDLYGSGFKTLMDEAAAAGYVTMSMNYRLTGTKTTDGQTAWPWPTQINDVNCAIAWLTERADQYNLDINAIGVAGLSAGGHLALVAGEGESATGGDCPNNGSTTVHAAVSMAGPGDTVKWWELDPISRSNLRAVLNKPDNETPTTEELESLSPRENISTAGVPTMFIHGEDDIVVNVAISEDYHNDLFSLGRETHFLRLNQAGHTFKANWDEYPDVTISPWSVTKQELLKWFDITLKQEGDVELRCSPYPSCLES